MKSRAAKVRTNQPPRHVIDAQLCELRPVEAEPNLRHRIERIGLVLPEAQAYVGDWARLLVRAAGVRHGPDVERSHHLVILVRQDVAVPDVATRAIEASDDACHLTRQRHDRILPAIFVGLRGALSAVENDRRRE